MASVLPSPEQYAELAPTPGSPVWRAFNDARLLGTAGLSLLLQVAHPTVGAGVSQYSTFKDDPWGRLLRTLDYVHGTIYGGPARAGEIGARVRGAHRTIRGSTVDGTRYSAMEPGAFAWVHATLAYGVVRGHEQLTTPMTAAERDAFWGQWRQVGRLIGVRDRDLPERWVDFEAYVDATIDETLGWTPAVPDVMATLAAATPPSPVVSTPLWRVASAPAAFSLRVTTTGLLPERLRVKLGLPFSRTDERAFRASAAATRALSPVIRGPLANFGPSYVRWRRAALERGDVGSAIPDPKPAPVAAVG